MKSTAMWACPKCGHRFLRRNRTHSCGNYKIADRFVGKSDNVRDLFAAFRGHLIEYGPLTVYAQKTGIIFQKRHRFALAAPRKNWIDIALCLWKPRKHKTLRKIEYFGGRCHRHWFRIDDRRDMNKAFGRLLKESIEVGCSNDCRTLRSNRPVTPAVTAAVSGTKRRAEQYPAR